MDSKVPRFFLCGLHLFLGVNGMVGGLLLMLRPNGFYMGMTTDWLQRSPFSNYFIPGLLLFFCIGVFSSLTLFGLMTRVNSKVLNAVNLYSDRHWSWAFSLYVGIVSISWITFQLIMTSYFWIQPVIIFTGLLILIFSLTPGVMRFYKTQ